MYKVFQTTCIHFAAFKSGTKVDESLENDTSLSSSCAIIHLIRGISMNKILISTLWLQYDKRPTCTVDSTLKTPACDWGPNRPEKPSLFGRLSWNSENKLTILRKYARYYIIVIQKRHMEHKLFSSIPFLWEETTISMIIYETPSESS